MTRILSQNDIILNLLNLIKVSQPDLNVIPGSVARDLFVDLPSSQIALLYEQLSVYSNLQSLRYLNGSDLDNYLANYGLYRNKATKSSGLCLLTFASLNSIVAINAGDLVYSNNGLSFVAVNGVAVNPNNANSYKSIATKYKNDLDFLNITDQYAVEITVQATATGAIGNIAKYSLNKTNIPSVSNATNVFSFTGGTDQEDDNSFRNRGLSIFSGSNTGTDLGYKNTALSNSSVLDALVIGPGDPLMTRDGTVSVKNADNTYTIVSEGNGNKVDVVILGTNLNNYTDSFIYQDKSNTGDPTNSKNDFVLGQITGDSGKTINRRRIDDFAAGTLPAQPVQTITSISGSSSGSNFIAKSVDEYGRVSGNYEIIKDSTNFAGSVFGSDRLAWVSNKISLFGEDRIKEKFNGQDNLTFTDVLQIPKIEQNITITNENSLVQSSDRTIIQLLHTPATNITRVFNVNTGERYTVTNQNLDGTGSANSTGRIRISGNTLPTTSDVLQVDYLWIVNYDCYSDYDGKIISSNIRNADDSIDWGLSNAIKNELTVFTKNTDGAYYSGTVNHPISSIVSCNLFSQANSSVYTVSTGNFTGRLALNINSLSASIDSIANINLQNSTLELYKTVDNDGLVFNQRVLVGSQILYNAQIILPTDTPAQVGNTVSVYFNQVDVFTVNGVLGNFNANQITIPTTNVYKTDASLVMRVNYFANIQDVLTQSITNLPVSRIGNSFSINSNNGFTNANVSNCIIKENQIIQLNGSNQPYINLNLSVSDYNLSINNVVSIVSLSTNKELWNEFNKGSIDSSGSTYNLILSGYNSPTIGDNVLVLYKTVDIQRTQPFTFSNSLIKKTIQQVKKNGINNQLYIDFNTLADGYSHFSILDPLTNLNIADGYGTISVSNSIATMNGSTVNFNTITDLQFKKIQIVSSVAQSNVGTYDIVSVNTISNTLNFTFNVDNVNNNQISITRLLDGKEVWNNGTIDIQNNRLIFTSFAQVQENDYVVSLILLSNNLRQAPSKISITVADQVNNTGIISISGNTFNKVDSIVFTATANGLKQNAAEAIRKYLGLSSNSSIPSTISLARIVKLQKVNTASDGTVLSVINNYDILGTSLNDNTFYSNESIDDNTLSNLEFKLPSTSNNNANTPQIGDTLLITLYYNYPNDSENIAFTRNGTLYTNKNYSFINKIYISSGFSSTSARFTFSYLNQPLTGSRYRVYYDYTAPKQNERIIINYNYNKLISDVSFDIENSRPLNADVLVKEANKLLVDITMNVVISTNYLTSASLVLQNLQDSLVAAINTNKLNDILDSSDLIAIAQKVDGIDRVRIIYFNENGGNGSVLSLLADKNQYFSANNVKVFEEYR